MEELLLPGIAGRRIAASFHHRSYGGTLRLNRTFIARGRIK
jgi:hypothetical protein